MTNPRRDRVLRVLLAAIGFLAVFAPDRASAQATRTWVSGVGDDVNPCSRTAPCKTFAGAIAKTAAGGEIDTLDPGNFGTVTITKSITIDGGTLGTTTAAGANGVIVNGASAAHVILRNLTINGVNDSLTHGLSGIRFLAGGSLTIENCVIANFDTYGIDQTGGGDLVVHATVFRNMVQGGIHVAPTSGTPKVLLLDTRLEEGAFGLYLTGNVLATVRNTHASRHVGPGFWADGAGVDLALDGVTAAMNTVGVQASNGADVRTGDLTVFGNATTALLEETGGTITPFSGDLVAGNPPSASNVCGIQVQSPIVNCVDATCPTPSCPQPSCPQPNVQIAGSLGPCKKCKTKAGKTTCTGCPVNLQ